MALVLAIEPDLRQAEILTRIVREQVKADVVIVDSRDAAMEAMRTTVPDVMLLSALLSPRDEDELVAHLRTLDSAEHLQTHTIPQLASAGGNRHSGTGGGLLKAFRRKKTAQPAVAGCDPDLFAQEIRAFLEQAEQKRAERAEQLKYRPAVRPIAAVLPSKTDEAAQASTAAGATTSWDSPFEWRRSDASPPPLTAFEEAPVPDTFRRTAPPPPEIDTDFDGHLLEPSSIDPNDAAIDGNEAAPPVFDAAATPPFHAEPAPAFELPELPPFEPEAEPAMEAPAVPSFDDENAPVASLDAAPEPAPEPEPELELELELPETYAAPPDVPSFETAEFVAPLEPEAVAVAEIAASADPIPELITFDNVAAEPVTDAEIVAPLPIEMAAASLPTPEEIESYGRVESLPEIEWIADSPADNAYAEPEPQASAPATMAAAGDVEEIDLNWSDAEAADVPSVAEAVDIDLDALAVSVETMDTASDVDMRAPRKSPPNLGPLATWARLERRNSDERHPGSDMREIIERLAVPPHIAGVSYARGVRIRRVRVAGSQDRRRPADQSGPVILSRRALAATRSNGPAPGA